MRKVLPTNRSSRSGQTPSPSVAHRLFRRLQLIPAAARITRSQRALALPRLYILHCEDGDPAYCRVKSNATDGFGAGFARWKIDGCTPQMDMRRHIVRQMVRMGNGPVANARCGHGQSAQAGWSLSLAVLHLRSTPRDQMVSDSFASGDRNHHNTIAALQHRRMLFQRVKEIRLPSSLDNAALMHRFADSLGHACRVRPVCRQSQVKFHSCIDIRGRISANECGRERSGC